MLPLKNGSSSSRPARRTSSVSKPWVQVIAERPVVRQRLGPRRTSINLSVRTGDVHHWSTGPRDPLTRGGKTTAAASTNYGRAETEGRSSTTRDGRESATAGQGFESHRWATRRKTATCRCSRRTRKPLGSSRLLARQWLTQACFDLY